MAVIGAGYIAVELAGVFQTLGTDTTLLVRRDRPLRSFDSLLVDTLVKEMDKSGLTLKPHATTKVIERKSVILFSLFVRWSSTSVLYLFMCSIGRVGA